MRSFMFPMSGRGLELQLMLRKELGIPATCRWFEVRFERDEPVRVTCEFIPEERSEGLPAQDSAA